MDGHSSHVAARVIAYCMDKAIDLLILPPHTSHLTQPLDVGIFGPLKRALAQETDSASQLDCGRMARVEWTEMYINARNRAFSVSNILAGWRGAGLWPLSPVTVLEKVPQLDVEPEQTSHSITTTTRSGRFSAAQFASRWD